MKIEKIENMKIDIDVNKIVEQLDINKLVEENIVSSIGEQINFEDMIENLLENEEVKKVIEEKVINIIGEYINSVEGKNYIIETFNNAITNSDILEDEKITDVLAEFLRKNFRKL